MSELSPLVLLLWLVNVLVDTGGQLAFKAAAATEDANSQGEQKGLARCKHLAAQPWLWLGVACYVVEFLVWLAFLSLVPLSEGVLLGSVNIVAVMLAGRLFFGERLSALRVVGIVLVSAGVAVVGLQ